MYHQKILIFVLINSKYQLKTVGEQTTFFYFQLFKSRQNNINFLREILGVEFKTKDILLYITFKGGVVIYNV